MEYLMGIDVGTTGVKIVIIDRDGKVIGTNTVEYPLITPKPGWAEQNPNDWWDATIKCIKKILKKTGIKGEEIKGIGLTGQMHGSVFLDSNYNVIYPAILWCDQRTAKECEEINEIVGQDRIFEITCNPVLTGFQAPKILWLRKNQPDIYKNVRKILLPKDYIRYCLTGDFATDVSDASGTSLFDVKNRKWSNEILEKLNLEIDLLPKVYEGTEITGYIKKDIAKITGLSEKTPVVAGGGDQASGGVGNGIVEEGKVSVTIGTSGVVFAHSEKVIVDPKGRLHTFCHAVPGKWHLMGVMLSAGGSFRWLRDNLCEEEKKEGKRKKIDPYEIMTEKAKDIPVGSEGLIFLPYLTGERCPYPDPNARGVFFGLSLKHTKINLIRSVMEGITFGLKDSIKIMNEINLPIGENFIASGGGGKSSLWCQMMADIFGKNIIRLECQEGAPFGAAILASVGVGIYKDVKTACKVILKEKDSFKFDKERFTEYEKFYKIYRELYFKLKNSFDTLAKIL
ncbi:MAG: xylulokinase [Candidatus Omnitrophica bacterium]|nr:xylulokinase [Candidatus Omnitrophota bacterium]MCM8801807.1 xylulokinase [Candidatus Omnitrophota bacterium]